MKYRRAAWAVAPVATGSTFPVGLAVGVEDEVTPVLRPGPDALGHLGFIDRFLVSATVRWRLGDGDRPFRLDVNTIGASSGDQTGAISSAGWDVSLMPLCATRPDTRRPWCPSVDRASPPRDGGRQATGAGNEERRVLESVRSRSLWDRPTRVLCWLLAGRPARRWRTPTTPTLGRSVERAPPSLSAARHQRARP